MSSLVSRSSKKTLQTASDSAPANKGLGCGYNVSGLVLSVVLLLSLAALYAFPMITLVKEQHAQEGLSRTNGLMILQQNASTTSLRSNPAKPKPETLTSSKTDPEKSKSISNNSPIIKKSPPAKSNLSGNNTTSANPKAPPSKPSPVITKYAPSVNVSIPLKPEPRNPKPVDQPAPSKPIPIKSSPQTQSATAPTAKPGPESAEKSSAASMDYEGKIIKVFNDATVYLVKDGKRHGFTTGDEFLAKGYKWNQIQIVGLQAAQMYPVGEPINKMPKL